MRADIEALLRDYVAGDVYGLKGAGWRFAEEAEGAPGGAAPIPRAGAAEDAILDRLDRDRGAMRLFHPCFCSLTMLDQTVLEGYVKKPTGERYRDFGALYYVALELPMVRAGYRLGEGRIGLLRAIIKEMGIDAVESMASDLVEAAGRRLTNIVDMAREEREAANAQPRPNRYTHT